MPWFINNSELLDAMADLAKDPEKLAAFRASPEAYVEGMNLDDDAKAAILGEDPERMLQALMSRIDGEGKGAS